MTIMPQAQTINDKTSYRTLTTLLIQSMENKSGNLVVRVYTNALREVVYTSLSQELPHII